MLETGGFGCVVVHETARGTVAWLRGDLDLMAAPMLVQQLVALLDLPLDRLTLDMADVEWVDADGVAAVNVIRRRAASRRIPLVLDSVPTAVSSACDISSWQSGHTAAEPGAGAISR